MSKKPLDILARSINGEILIRLKDGTEYQGILVETDNYMNLIIKDAKEIYFGRGGKRSKDLGTVMIRGASIIFIGQDREKIILSQVDEQEDSDHDSLMHREEFSDF